MHTDKLGRILCRILKKSIMTNRRHIHASNCYCADISKIRNIGIMAHIDAGKTTTTERMLYYSGKICSMGEVHEGTTVTDYLEQERTRGITITSASVSIPWLEHTINIIDTPGHIDFTFEVEQSLNVLDSAIIILDGSAGVEAQTITVWRQADKYNIPRMVYINKMDRMDSSLERCLHSLKCKFETEFLPLQIPVRGSKSGIIAIIDVITGDLLTWRGKHGEEFAKKRILETDRLYEISQSSRSSLIDQLTDLDEEMTTLVLKKESMEGISEECIYQALRRVTFSRKGVPVLCGSSYKNIGVQKVLDAIVNILPSPDMRTDLNLSNYFDGNLAAKAFKIVHDTKRGPITFFRIYSGFLKRGQKVYNINRDKSEQIQRIMVALADDYQETQMLCEGNIAAIAGLKSCCSGDVITNNSSAVRTAINKFANEKKITAAESEQILFPELKSLDPVFFCSIEAPSPAYEKALEEALEQLQKEDPSLKVKIDPDTHQTVMGGMGELHLEIIKDRIRKQYNLKVYTGPLQIAYKERVLESVTKESSLELNLGTNKYKANITMTVLPKQTGSEPLLEFNKSIEFVENIKQITPKQISLIINGIENALSNGPRTGSSVINTRFILHKFDAKKYTTDSVVSSVAAKCTQELLSAATCIIVEPIMHLEISVPKSHSHFVMSDLSNKRADILSYEMRDENEVINALAPLSGLLGYSKSLRVGTSGTAFFSMEFHSYRDVSGEQEREAIKNITGFYP